MKSQIRWAGIAIFLAVGWTSIAVPKAVSVGIDNLSVNDQVLRRIREFIFPKIVARSGSTMALKYRDDGYRFASLEQINEYNVDSQHVRAGTAGIVSLDYAPLESPFRSRLLLNEGGAELIDGLHAILEEAVDDSSRRSVSERWTVLEKAVAQRDLYQTYALVALGQRTVDDTHRALAATVLARLARMIEPTVLDEAEYQQLVEMRPRAISPQFASKPSLKLRINYLPSVVLRDDPTWLEIATGGQPFRHFTHFRGRSFVRVFFRVPKTSPAETLELRKKLYAKYGDSIHTMAVEERVPRGMETLLVRSFGVLLKDGSYRNSFWPEEVIIRAFKYDRATVDRKTSDFTGTVHYQYRLSRERLLHNPRTLGLVRIKDDEEEFFGFFGDVPDLRMAYAATTTTMRVNCMSCHAELYYGLATIFSLERNPALDAMRQDNEVWRELEEGRFQLRTEEYESLASYLRDPSASSGTGCTMTLRVSQSHRTRAYAEGCAPVP